MTEPFAASLQAALAALATWLDRERIAATLIGGVAASILGRLRLTQDIGRAGSLARGGLGASGTASGSLWHCAAIENALDFARRSRVLLLRHSASDIDLDIVLGRLPFERDGDEHVRLEEFDKLVAQSRR